MTTHTDFELNRAWQQAITPVGNAFGITSETLAADVEAFLQRGGQIEAIPYGATAIVPVEEMPIRDVREMMRKSAYDSIGRRKGSMHAIHQQTFATAKAKRSSK